MVQKYPHWKGRNSPKETLWSSHLFLLLRKGRNNSKEGGKERNTLVITSIPSFKGTKK
jgi:hypothetical protein